MNSRNELGKLFQEHNRTGLAAEVGTYAGDFAKLLSQDYTGKILAIDYFDEHDFMYDTTLEERCRKTLEGTNCEVIKGRSLEVANTILDESLDWVYIDADHSYESAKADIAAWMPKVRKGGIVSGHDYIKNYSVSNVEFGVWRAVDELNVPFELIHDTISGADFASWYFVKE